MTSREGGGEAAPLVRTSGDGGDEVAAVSSTSYQSALVWISLSTFLCAGPTFGCVAFHNALVDGGAFSGYCAPSHPASAGPCYRQKIALAQAFQIIPVFNGVLSWPIAVYVVPRFGGLVCLRVATVATAIGLMISGAYLEYGVSFVVGFAAVSIAEGCNLSVGRGQLIPMAACGPKTAEKWTMLASGVLDAGFLVGPALGFVAAQNLVLPVWAWFLVIGGAFGAVLIPWFETAVVRCMRTSPRRHAFDRQRQLDECDTPARTSASLLRDKYTWLASLQGTLSVVVVTSFEASALHTAPWFGWEPRVVLFYLPVVVGVASSVFVTLVFLTPLAHSERSLLTLRVLAIVISAALWTVPAAQTRLGYLGGLAFGGFWRAIAFASCSRSAFMNGHGGAEVLSISIVMTVIGVLSILLGQLTTYLMGYSLTVFTVVVVVVAVLSFLVEVLCHNMVLDLKERLSSSNLA